MNMNKFFSIMLSGALFCACTVPANTAEKESKPNVIFILTDDLGYGDLGVMFQKQRAEEGNRSEPWQFSPHLDELAKSGARLTDFYCNAPVCAPSRASLLLGVHQGHSNVRDNQFDKALADNYTLGNVMQELGYSTVAIGKWGLQGDTRWDSNGDEWPAFPLNRGFDDFFGYVRHVDGHEHYPKEGVYRGAKEVYSGRDNVTNQLDKCYTGDLWTAYAKKWIADHIKTDGKKPFFMYLAYDVPHAVWELPTQAYPEGQGLKGGLQWTGEPGRMINTASGEVDSWMHPDYANATYDDDNNPATPEEPWPESYKRYSTSVRRIDDGVGDLRQLLKDLKISENTIVVFASDNGPSEESYLGKTYGPNKADFFNSFGPFDGIKRDAWEGGVRVPTLVSWPSKIPAGQVIATPGMSSDWMATFCDAAGVAAPARTDGVSILPSLTGKGEQEEGLVYVEYFHPSKTPAYPEFESDRQKRPRKQMQMIRLGDYVGVRYDIQSADDDFEIYNVVEDPKETANLAKNDGMQKLQVEMKQKAIQVRRPDTAVARPYDQALMSPVDLPTEKGVVWKIFNNSLQWIPSTSGLTPVSTGKADAPEALLMKDGANLLVCEGYLNIPKDGKYNFTIKAQGKALMRIHGALLIDADYGYKSGEERNGEILLKAGLHPFRFYYKKADGAASGFTLDWEGPAGVREAVPDDAFHRGK